MLITSYTPTYDIGREQDLDAHIIESKYASNLFNNDLLRPQSNSYQL